MNNNFKKVRELVVKYENELTYPTFVYSVLDKVIKGKVFIDDSNRTALVGTDSGIFVVVGDTNNNRFNFFLSEYFVGRKNENKRFTLFSPSKEWDITIKELLEHELREVNRYSFQLNESKFSKLLIKEVPEGFSLRKTDGEVIRNSQDFNDAYLNEYWSSPSNFLEKGFGYCITNHNNLASECVSIFASTQAAEMDIVTQNRYRGLGLGQIVAQKFILKCIEDQKTPRWDCDVNNIASIKLAEKLGFENPIQYSVFVKN